MNPKVTGIAQQSLPQLTRPAEHRCLQRHGIEAAPGVEGEMPKRQKFKCNPTGLSHIDIVEVQATEGKPPVRRIDGTSKVALAQFID